MEQLLADPHRSKRWGIVLLLLSPYIFILAYVFGLWMDSRLHPSTTFQNPRIDEIGDDVDHMLPPQAPARARRGQFVHVAYDVTRYVDCTLDISRLIRNKSLRQERQIDYTVQPITADRPPMARPSGYTAQIRLDVARGPSQIFSRVRYRCNILDEIRPRYVDMDPVDILIE